MLLSWPGGVRLMADDTLTIDDRSSGDFAATLGGSWRMIADGVMGGASTGRLSLETVDDKACLRLQGQVRLENNGGFIQAALNLADTPAVDASAYTGLLLEVHGNDQQYNLHLRTALAILSRFFPRAVALGDRATAVYRLRRLPYRETSGPAAP